ncbi:hypothetical protein ACH4SK_34520 [Streptomyces inhibens]|uniref:hypothetical protein n=1 Tax=Streptomyces inhibens TaxID=2293571 RepID=UPI00378C012A
MFSISFKRRTISSSLFSFFTAVPRAVSSLNFSPSEVKYSPSKSMSSFDVDGSGRIEVLGPENWLPPCHSKKDIRMSPSGTPATVSVSGSGPASFSLSSDLNVSRSCPAGGTTLRLLSIWSVRVSGMAWERISARFSLLSFPSAPTRAVWGTMWWAVSSHPSCCLASA